MALTLSFHDDFAYLTLTDNPAEHEELRAGLPILVSPALHAQRVVLNLEHCGPKFEPLVPFLLSWASKAKNGGKQLLLYNFSHLPSKALQMLQGERNLGRVEGPLDLGQALSGPAQTHALIPFVFTLSAVEVLARQCQQMATVGEARLKRSGDTPQFLLAMAAFVPLDTAIYKGAVALCFGQETFLTLMQGMLGEPCEMGPELEDGAGELLNMIYGMAKTKLNVERFGFEIALPTLIRGEALSIRYFSSAPVLVVPLETSAGTVVLEFGKPN